MGLSVAAYFMPFPNQPGNNGGMHLSKFANHEKCGLCLMLRQEIGQGQGHYGTGTIIIRQDNGAMLATKLRKPRRCRPALQHSQPNPSKTGRHKKNQ